MILTIGPFVHSYIITPQLRIVVGSLLYLSNEDEGALNAPRILASALSRLRVQPTARLDISKGMTLSRSSMNHLVLFICTETGEDGAWRVWGSM